MDDLTGLLLMGVPGLMGGSLPAYYVNAATGNDTTGDGSFSAPWATVKKALESGVPIDGGCQILVQAGTYTATNYILLTREFVAPVYVRPRGGAVTIQGDGTQLASILIGSTTKNVVFDGVTLSNNGSDYTVLFANNSNTIENISFEDCIITNPTAGGVGIGFLNVQATGCNITRCTITVAGVSAIDIEGRAGSSQYVENMIIRDCTITAPNCIRFSDAGFIRNVTIDGCTITPGAVGIGKSSPGCTGPITNITINDCEIEGDGVGIEFGGAGGAGIVSGLTITNCNVDATANNKIGLRLVDYVEDSTVTGGDIIGGNTNGYGGIAVEGANCDNITFTNVRVGSDAPDPVTNRVLAMGVSGSNILVDRCHAYGNGRGFTTQNNAWDVEFRDCTSEAEDMGLRIGHDATDPYTSGRVKASGCEFTSLYTPALVIGSGVYADGGDYGALIEDCILIGGDGAIRLRGNAANDGITIQNNTLSRNPLASGTSAMIEAYGAQDVTITGNTVNADGGSSVIKTDLQDALTLADVVMSGNTINVSNAVDVYEVQASTLGTGNVFDGNTINMNGTGDFGSILGTAVATLNAARRAWDGYGDGSNDDTSVVVWGGTDYDARVQAVKSANLIAHFELDGDATDSSANGYDGAASAGVAWSDAGIGDGQQVADVGSDYINLYTAGLASEFDPDAFGFSVWVRAADAAWASTSPFWIAEFAVNSSNRITLYHPDASDTVRVLLSRGGENITLNGTIADGAWHHIAVAVTGGGATYLWIDGAQAATDTASGTWSGALDSNRAVLAATNAGSPALQMAGQLAHAALWDAALEVADAVELAKM